MPELSVLMPAYNAESTIALATRTTLAALPGDAELVVLDDGSTDGTASVVDGLGDPRLRLLSRTNGGVSSALNELLRRTDSRLVARMDADDLCLPRRFTRQIAACRTAEVTFSTIRHWNGTGRPRPARPRGIGVHEFPYHLLLTNPVAHSTMLAERGAIEQVGGYRDVPGEDYDLWLRLAASGTRMRRLALPGLAYRLHADQVTAATGWRRRSWENQQMAEAFSTLAEHLLGQPATRITSLSIAQASRQEKLRRFDEFAEAYRRATATLPTTTRRRLRRRLAERERWLRSATRPTNASVPPRHDTTKGRSS